MTKKLNVIYQQYDNLRNEIFFEAFIQYPFDLIYTHYTIIPIYASTEIELRKLILKSQLDLKTIQQKRRDILKYKQNPKLLNDFNYLLHNNYNPPTK